MNHFSAAGPATTVSARLELALPAVTAAALTAGGVAWIAGAGSLAGLF